MARSNRLTRVFALALALCSLFGCTQRPDTTEPPVETTHTAEVMVTPAIPETPIAAPESASPEITPEATPEQADHTAPTYPDLTEQPAVDDEFFSTAAFLGNSLIDGFRLFSGVNTCDYYCATSMTVTGAGDLIGQMAQKDYERIYILLGINEIGYQVDYFADLYQKMLDTIKADHPDSEIYIMGLTPVSQQKSSTDSTFTMDRVRTYNDALRTLAADNECWYVDLCEGLSGSDGYLPADVTTDGVHFGAGHYKVWADYLKTHYNPA